MPSVPIKAMYAAAIGERESRPLQQRRGKGADRQDGNAGDAGKHAGHEQQEARDQQRQEATLPDGNRHPPARRRRRYGA